MSAADERQGSTMRVALHARVKAGHEDEYDARDGGDAGLPVVWNLGRE